jgi:hypothetical protein
MGAKHPSDVRHVYLTGGINARSEGNSQLVKWAAAQDKKAIAYLRTRSENMMLWWLDGDRNVNLFSVFAAQWKRKRVVR